MSLTLPNIFNAGDFAAGCNIYINEHGAVRAKVEALAEYARHLLPLSDAAHAERDAAHAQRNAVEAMGQELRTAYQGSGSAAKFRAILGATTSEERNAIADSLASDSARINVLFSAVEHHDGYIGPKLAIAAQRQEVALLGALADMHAWNAVCVGIERAIAAQSLAKADGQVAYPAQGGKTNAAIKVAVEARGHVHGAEETLRSMERQFQEPRG